MGKQLSNVNVAKTMLVKRRALAKPSVTESHFETKPKWNRDGSVFLGKMDLSDEVIVGTPKGTQTTRSLRRMTEDRQWNPETLRMFVGVPWNPRGIITDSPGGIRKRYDHKSSGANTWSDRRLRSLSR